MSVEIKDLKNKEMERREKELAVKQMLQDTEQRVVELKQLEEKVRGQSQALHLLFGQWHKVCVSVHGETARVEMLAAMPEQSCLSAVRPEAGGAACLCVGMCEGVALPRCAALTCRKFWQDYFINKSKEEVELENYFLA